MRATPISAPIPHRSLYPALESMIPSDRFDLLHMVQAMDPVKASPLRHRKRAKHHMTRRPSAAEEKLSLSDHPVQFS